MATPHRRTVLCGVAVGLAGCLDRFQEPDQPESDANPALDEAAQLGDLQLSSPAFDDGEAIPRRYGYEEDNVNPPLEIGGTPADAAALALVVDDPDAVDPAGKIWVHWLVWNIPPETTSIPEDWTAESAIEGENDFGELGYGGPTPPDEEHRYRFKLYALGSTLALSEGATVDQLGLAMADHVTARTQHEGTYAP